METNQNSVPRAYLIDYGGTLDTGGQHWGHFIWQAYRDAGVPVAEQEYRDAYVATERALGRAPIIDSHFTFRETLSVKLDMQLKLLGCTEYHPILLENLYAQTLQHVAASQSVLRQLKTHSTLALVSNFYGNLSTVLREFSLDSLFDCVVESAAVGVRKPDVAIFLLALEALRLQPAEVTVVGDSYKNDIIPAHAIGCRTVWLRGRQWTEQAIDNPVADRIITDLKELL